MLCPICNVDLALSEKQGIEIDYCPKCRGIWLDRGELEKIIERSSVIEESYKSKARDTGMSDKYRDDDYDHKYKSHGNYKKKSKSFLGDLFDL